MRKKSIKEVPNFIQQVDWPVDSVCAFTTNRRSDVNYPQVTSAYSSFNLGLHVGDDETQVIANRLKLLDYLPIDTNIQWLEQVHGNDVAVVDRVNAKAIIADAAVTRAPNVALAIMTADCLPILLSDKQGAVIAAIHGGWRPLAGNIIERTIIEMDVEPNELVAWLGPCIGANAFEVGPEVKAAFVDISMSLAKAFELKTTDNSVANLPSSELKYLCNLQQVATILLTNAGVSMIKKLPDCTYSSPEQYYSYRRDKVTGRMASVICKS